MDKERLVAFCITHTHLVTSADFCWASSMSQAHWSVLPGFAFTAMTSNQPASIQPCANQFNSTPKNNTHGHEHRTCSISTLSAIYKGIWTHLRVCIHPDVWKLRDFDSWLAAVQIVAALYAVKRQTLRPNAMLPASTVDYFVMVHDSGYASSSFGRKCS